MYKSVVRVYSVQFTHTHIYIRKSGDIPAAAARQKGLASSGSHLFTTVGVIFNININRVDVPFSAIASTLPVSFNIARVSTRLFVYIRD